MSESASTRTKTETAVSESTEDPLIAQDRWTNNISYRQLVMSSCISIVQFWWHPYIHDFRRLVPFVFLYNVFSIFLAFPLFYLELAVGVATKKGVLNCWDMAPVARGVGIAMILTCLYAALTLAAVSAWNLKLMVHSVHSFLPWLHCAAAAHPPCAARHRPLPQGSETPAQSFFFNFVLELKRDGLKDGFGNIVPELAFYYVISWFLIYFVSFKRIYGYSKLVLYKDLLSFFVLTCCGIGVTRLEGAGKMFSECDWGVLFENFQIWTEALEYSFLQMAISQGTLIMLGSYCPKQKHQLTRTALMAFGVSKATCTGCAFILGGVHGALHEDYENGTNLWKGASSSMILWADYVTRIPGSQFWSLLVFYTMYVLSVTSAALLVQTVMSTFTGRSIRKITWAFLILICVISCFTGIITFCTQGGIYILNFLMTWPITQPRIPIAAIVATVITYNYGQSTFCEDVFYAVGEYPCMFLRICWAISPAILFTTFFTETATWPSGAVAGPTLVILTLAPVASFFLLYLIFTCRVRNIVSNEK